MWGEVSKGSNLSTGAYVTVAPFEPISEPGFRLQAFGSYDRYFYNEFGGNRVTGTTSEFDVLAGVEFGFGPARLTALAGPALVVDDIDGSVFGEFDQTSLGLRLAANSSLSLAPRTTLRVGGHFKTVRDDYAVNGRLTMPLTKSLAFGPSAQLKGNQDYQEVKLGGTISGVQLSVINLDLTGGVSLQDGDESAFFGLSTWTSF